MKQAIWKFSYKVSIFGNSGRHHRSFPRSLPRGAPEGPGEHLGGPHLSLLPPLECRRGLSEPLGRSFSPPLLPFTYPFAAPKALTYSLTHSPSSCVCSLPSPSIPPSPPPSSSSFPSPPPRFSPSPSSSISCYSLSSVSLSS